MEETSVEIRDAEVADNPAQTVKIDYERVLELALEVGVGILSCGG